MKIKVLMLYVYKVIKKGMQRFYFDGWFK